MVWSNKLRDIEDNLSAEPCSNHDLVAQISSMSLEIVFSSFICQLYLLQPNASGSNSMCLTCQPSYASFWLQGDYQIRSYFVLTYSNFASTPTANYSQAIQSRSKVYIYLHYRTITNQQNSIGVFTIRLTVLSSKSRHKVC